MDQNYKTKLRFYIKLCIICRRAREDEAAATKKLNEMIANYGDVIPRRDYEELQKQYEVLTIFDDGWTDICTYIPHDTFRYTGDLQNFFNSRLLLLCSTFVVTIFRIVFISFAIKRM